MWYDACFDDGFVVWLFQTTTKYASRDLILQELEKLGGICDCQASRYSGTCCHWLVVAWGDRVGWGDRVVWGDRVG